MGEMGKTYKFWSKNLKIPLGRPSHRWEDWGNRVRRCGLDASGSRSGLLVGTCSSIKCR